MNEAYRFDDHLEQIDIDDIEMQIAKLEHNLPFEVEEPKLFAKRIIKQSKGARWVRKQKMLSIGKVIASVACIVILGTTGIYASGMHKLYKSFAFFYDGGIVHIKSGGVYLLKEEVETLSKEAAEKLADGTWGTEEIDPSNVAIPIDEQYGSIQEVEEALNIEITLPKYIPTECIQDEEIKVRRLEIEKYKGDYVEMKYRSTENQDKVLRISAQYEQIGENVVLRQIRDGRKIATYTNAKGDPYNMLEQDGGILALTVKGNMEYLLLFGGFSEREMYEVIDSVDLSGYDN